MAEIGLPKPIPDRGLTSRIQSMASSMNAKVWKEARATPEAPPGLPPPGLPPPGLQVPGFSFNKDAPEFVPGLIPRAKPHSAPEAPPGLHSIGIESGSRVVWFAFPTCLVHLVRTDEPDDKPVSRKLKVEEWLQSHKQEFQLLLEQAGLEEANMHYVPRSSNAMAASSRDFEGDSDKQVSAVNKKKEFKRLANAKIAKQPSAAKKTEEECGDMPGHMPQFQEENRQTRMPSHMPHALEEANMHDVPRSSIAMAAPSQGFEGDIDKQAGNDTDHQEQPNQEESTHGSDAGEGKEGSRMEGQIDENEIGTGQSHLHGQKKRKGCRQRQRAKKYWRPPSPPEPYRKYNLPLSNMV